MEVLKEGNWKMYAMESVDEADFEEILMEGTVVGTHVLNTSGYVQYCFEWENVSRGVAATRKLPIEGQSNFRDLGGYKTKDGKYVKWGLVFRSGKCNELTDTDLAYLGTIPLKTVIDFRYEDEKALEPDRVPSTVTKQIAYPITPGNLSSINTSQMMTDPVLARQYMIDINEDLVINFQEEYTKFFENLQDETHLPLMFHCTAGKDRAGFAAALFLSSLGVDRETIMEDYLLTNTMVGASLENMKEIYGSYGDTFAECMYYVYSVQKEYIGKAFEIIDSEYDGVENYLTNCLNVDLAKMRELYLY
ncbi:MAG: tyrosine-protein phosphatase [Tannerellaceae bacterium]|nr:tyrosine-protein phosphatase [Tannerellaceae bacterium]